ncbi:MAG: cobalamin-independent methionine synthase II family protein [Candidatus Tectomicrobia bacterium]|uniref:Cobalamin-independent methionine synthase II family protein n=1 Tax=Tectimicrobiota bacterium TaxID=2528274 RepID=A0A937W0Z3_UNCTE|nr:cobalamin-independent methionine synthase II family protein [Candidatus Tectomicrobia bacterium]
MQRSDTRILTTHVGSLPRPATLTELFLRQERGETIDLVALEQHIEAATAAAVQKQLDVGLDIGNDGEQPRVAFHTYVAQRMRGFGGGWIRRTRRDITDFPDFAAQLQERLQRSGRRRQTPQAIGAVEYTDLSAAEQECALYSRCLAAQPRQFVESFMTAAAPGIIATAIGNTYYDSHENYVFAIARQMQKEYELIHAQGFVLQLDCPDLAMERAMMFQDEPLQRFQEVVEMHIAALNLAIANIPPERIRLHVCWGNSEGPHTHDVALEDIVPLLYQAKVGALSVELANPRHQHEYAAFKRYPLPDSMLFLPGVIDTTTNYVEHPEVVANRLCQAVDAVGDRSRVIASVDCGFGTFAGWNLVAESVVWVKLRTLVEGAALASRRLWG